jgi:hypothetical protein
MTINFENPMILSINKMFNGTTEDERTFTITAQWDEWDEWTVESIEWDGEPGTEEEEEEITEKFLEQINDQ